MIENLSIAVHAFVSRVSMSLSVDETLLPTHTSAHMQDHNDNKDERHSSLEKYTPHFI